MKAYSSHYRNNVILYTEHVLIRRLWKSEKTLSKISLWNGWINAGTRL